jgi:hypothetical protein
VTFNNSTPGTLIVTADGTTSDLSSGLQNVVKIIAEVPNNAAYTGAAALTLTSITVKNNSAVVIPTTGDTAVEKVVYFGDVTGNRAYQGDDAALISRVVVSTDSGFHAMWNVDPVVVADIDGSGNVDGIDASFVSQKAAHAPRPEIPDLPASLPPLVGGGFDPHFTLTSGTVVGPHGGADIVPISIDDATGLYAFDLAVSYDTAKLFIHDADITPGSVLTTAGGWNFTFNADHSDTPGVVYLDFYRATPMTGGTGPVVNLGFHAQATATTSTSNVGTDGPMAEGGLSFNYTGGTIAIDSDGPGPGLGNFNFNPSTGQPMNVAFTFGDNVQSSIQPTDLNLTNLTTSSTVSSGAISYTYDGNSNTVMFMFNGVSYPNGILPDGNYHAVIHGSDITDNVNNQMTGDAALDFFFLNGDPNRDRHVNALDFNILASNYGASTTTFQMGDFNYDGHIDSMDFSLLASRYNMFLAPPAAPALGGVVSSNSSDTSASPNAGLFSSTPVQSNKDDNSSSGTSLASDVLS